MGISVINLNETLEIYSSLLIIRYSIHSINLQDRGVRWPSQSPRHHWRSTPRLGDPDR